ncbi:hypothetical protein HanIR_Chr12g0564401 [Helianthus annuus]|nr:hypothetical protein HanIR_Chr12g0564401 [Helianthus annuus]
MELVRFAGTIRASIRDEGLEEGAIIMSVLIALDTRIIVMLHRFEFSLILCAF